MANIKYFQSTRAREHFEWQKEEKKLDKRDTEWNENKRGDSKNNVIEKSAHNLSRLISWSSSN